MDPEMEPPPSKRARVSLEPIPAAKITSIDVQGNMVLEPFVFDDLRHNTIFWWRSGPLLTTTKDTAETRFAKLVKQIDFTEPKDRLSSDTASTRPNENVWNQFMDNMGRARYELQQTYELIEWLKANNHLVSETIYKPPLPQDVLQSDVISAFLSKRKVLQNAGSTLKDAASRLRGSIDKSNQFFNQVLELRKRWRVGGIEKQSIASYQPVFIVDISNHDGAKVKDAKANVVLRKDDDGKVFIDPSDVSFRYISVSPADAPHVQLPPVKVSKPTGVEECHAFLEAYQQSYWHSVVLKHLQKDAADASIPDMLVGEDEISFTANRASRVSLKLMTRTMITNGSRENLNADADGMDVDGAEATPEPLAPLPVIVSTPRGPECAAIEVALHQMIRRYRTQRTVAAQRLVLSSPMRIAQLEAPQTSPILKQIVEVSSHVYLVEELRKQLDKLREGLADICSDGGLSVKWRSNDSPTSLSISISFPIRFSLSATVRGTKIFIGQENSASSPFDAVGSIIQRLARHILAEVNTQATALLGPTNVQRKGASVLFKLEKTNSVATVCVLPLRNHSIDIQLSVENHFDESTEDLVWSEIPGDDHLQKISHLILTQGVPLALR